MTRRFVWTGRLEGVWPGGADGWSHSLHAVVAELGRAEDVLILDAPSFPWHALTRPMQDARFVIRLPDELDAEALGLLLDGPLFSSVTPYDRLLHPRPEIRDALTERFALPDVWIPYDAPRTAWTEVLTTFLEADVEGLARSRLLKPRFNQLVQAVNDELDTCGSKFVGVSGDPAVRAKLAAKPGRDVWRSDCEPDGGFRTSPDAAVVVLQDGGQLNTDRLSLFRSAHQLLDPGGQLVVVGFVVDEPDGPANPTMSELIAELHEATGTSIHLEELRSIRWAGEPMTRGVLLRFTSLKVGAI